MPCAAAVIREEKADIAVSGIDSFQFICKHRIRPALRDLFPAEKDNSGIRHCRAARIAQKGCKRKDLVVIVKAADIVLRNVLPDRAEIIEGDAAARPCAADQKVRNADQFSSR